MNRVARIMVSTIGARRTVMFVDAVMEVMNNNAKEFATYLMSKGYRGEGFKKVRRRIDRTDNVRHQCRLILTDRHNEFRLWVEKTRRVENTVENQIHGRKG